MFKPSDAQITNTALKTRVKPHNNLIIRINFIRLCYRLNFPCHTLLVEELKVGLLSRIKYELGNTVSPLNNSGEQQSSELQVSLLVQEF